LPNILNLLFNFSDELKKSIDDFSPHHLANYLYYLAKEFNSYYGETKILDPENLNKAIDFRILEVFINTMEKGLELLAIKTVDKM
jgi:arginyl-tRNA synthetase